MRPDFARFLEDVNIFGGKFGVRARRIVLGNQLREMQRAGKARGARAHNQNIRVQPLTLDRHRLILADWFPAPCYSEKSWHREGYCLARPRRAAS